MRAASSAVTAALACAASMAASGAAWAEVNVCVTVSATGPAASLGVPELNTVPMLPTEAAGQTIVYTALDDATDPTIAVRNARKCIEEEGADLIIGSSTTPTAMAVAGVGAETSTPVIALAPISVPEDVEPWTFRAPQHVGQMADALIAHMQAGGVTTLGFIGYSDGYGDLWFNIMEAKLADSGITMAPVERFARTDTSVTGQVLQLVAAQPDAVLVVASGTPAALPNLALLERGYTGQIYHTHGSASLDFIRVAGAAAEGTIMPVGPIIVAEQLPESHPSREVAIGYATAYEAEFGAGSLSSFGGHMFDAGQMLTAVLPVALEAGEPGTPEFRAGLRDALESMTEVVGVHGVFNTTPDDHYGHDARSRVLVRVEDGAWVYMPAE